MKICSSRKKNNWWWYTSSLNYTCGQITHLFFQLSGFSFRGRQLFSRFRLILFTTHAKYEWTLYSERDRESSSPPNESFDQIKLTLLVWDASSRICNLKLEHSLLFHLCRGRVETTLEGFISDFVFINWPLTSSLSSVSVSEIIFFNSPVVQYYLYDVTFVFYNRAFIACAPRFDQTETNGFKTWNQISIIHVWEYCENLWA